MQYHYDYPDEYSRFPRLGGGDAYAARRLTRPTSQTADAVPLSGEQFADAVAKADRGDVIYVPDDQVLEITEAELEVPPTVTIVGDRGFGGGATLQEADDGVRPEPFLYLAAGCTLRGLNLKGTVTTAIDRDESRTTRAVDVVGDGVEIDNCTFRGWGHAGVMIGPEAFVEDTHVHHCEFVDNPMGGYGYGILVRHGTPRIERCYFDNNRHDVAASGHADCSYTVEHCLFGRHPVGHRLDMHSRKHHQDDEYETAGKSLTARHNTFLTDSHREDLGGGPIRSVYIRGAPADESTVELNEFAHARRPRGSGVSGDAVDANAPTFGEHRIALQNNLYGRVCAGGPPGVSPEADDTDSE